jgi:hypothetical protein
MADEYVMSSDKKAGQMKTMISAKVRREYDSLDTFKDIIRKVIVC